MFTRPTISTRTDPPFPFTTLFRSQAVLLDVFNASFHFTFALWVVAFTGIDSEARCRGEFMETRVQRQFPVLFAEDHQLGLVVHTFLGHAAEVTQRLVVQLNEGGGIQDRKSTRLNSSH